MLHAGWVVGNMLPLWYGLKFAGLLRATADEEALGLDSSHHGGSAYAGTPDDDTSKHANGISKVRHLNVCSPVVTPWICHPPACLHALWRRAFACPPACTRVPFCAACMIGDCRHVAHARSLEDLPWWCVACTLPGMWGPKRSGSCACAERDRVPEKRDQPAQGLHWQEPGRGQGLDPGIRLSLPGNWNP